MHMHVISLNNVEKRKQVFYTFLPWEKSLARASKLCLRNVSWSGVFAACNCCGIVLHCSSSSSNPEEWPSELSWPTESESRNGRCKMWQVLLGFTRSFEVLKKITLVDPFQCLVYHTKTYAAFAWRENDNVCFSANLWYIVITKLKYHSDFYSHTLW